MSYATFIGPHPTHESETFKINIEQFIDELKKRWTSAKVIRTPSPNCIVHWRMEMKGYPVLGRLQRSQHTMAIEGGDTTTDAQIAVWYRSIVPPEYELYFYTGPHIWTPIRLTTTTTVEEIVDAFNQLSS